MCGIVGFITSETKFNEDARARFLRQALIVDTLRGDDSTGVFGVQHEVSKTGPYWCKEVSDGYQFVHGDAYLDNFFDVSPYRAAVGHNRSATIGGVNVDAAHPFVVGPITLVHNGTLTSTGGLPLPMHSIEGCIVDSHAIAHNLAEHSVEDVVSQLDGAFTLVWHDARDDSMNIIRNKQRPMHMAMGKNQDTLFFASEGGMLDFIAQRINVTLGPIYYPKEGQHLKWLPDTELTTPIVADLDLHVDNWGVLAGYNAYRGAAASYGDGYWDHSLNQWIDYDDDWRGSGQTSGKYEPPQDDSIFVGGRKKAVPMLLQEELLKYDMVVEDRITFCPKVSVKVETGRVQIHGMLPGGYKAIMYSVLEATAGLMKRDWTVRPIAVYVRPSGEPTIIVKLVSTHGPNSPAAVVKAPSVVSILGYDIDENGEEMRYRGPYGARIGQSEWMKLTMEGCEFCECTLLSAQHESIKWINNGTMALCEDCAVNVHDNFDLNEEIPYE